jgi:capsid portal protein
MQRKQTAINRGNAKGESKKNVQAFAGFGLSPFLADDIFREPTKQNLDSSVIEYIPFSTLDYWRLDRLQAICNNSVTQSAIIQQTVNYFMGDGYFVVPRSSMNVLPSVRLAEAQKDVISIDAEISLNNWLVRLNPEGESIDEITVKTITDFKSFGNAFLELTRIQVGNTKVYYIRNLPITWCRPKKASENYYAPTHIGVNSEFESHYYTTPTAPIDLPIFPVFDDFGGGVEKSIIHLKNYEPTLMYWGIPDWVSAKIWAELEYRIPKFNQSKFENGFTPSAIISLFGSTNEEEAQQVVNAMKGCFTGTGNNSKMFIQALRDETSKADVQILNNNYDGEFTQLQKLSQESIISANRWTVALTGLKTAGSLGTNQQIRSEFDIVYNTVIRPLQRMFLGKFLNPVIQDANKFLGNNWNSIALDISKGMPVSFAGDIKIDQILTQDEQRAEIGFQPLSNQQTEEINDNTN